MTSLPRFALALTAVIATGATVSAQSNLIVSIGTDGTLPNRDSYFSVISADGRFIAFQSEASNLVAGDTNGQYDIFVHDRHTGVTELASVATTGNSGNRLGLAPAISGDGRYVLFHSDSSNLVSGDTNGTWDVFIRDRFLGVTERISLDHLGNQANDRSDSPEITPDGRYVSFHSDAALVPDDTNNLTDVYRKDRQTGDLVLVSQTDTGTQGNSISYGATISADGNRIVFMSSASNLVPGDTNGWGDVFLKDLTTNTLERINVSSSGVQSNSETIWPRISPDGTRVAFCSRGSTLVSGDSNNNWDAFVRDTTSSTTTRINVRPDGSQADSYVRSTTYFTQDNRFVIFASLSTNLVSNDTNGEQDVFLRDLVDENTTRIGMAFDGSQANDDAFVPAISADGRHMTFTSWGSNLDPRDNSNVRRDIFYADLFGSLSLTATPLVRGDVATFTVNNATNGESVVVAYTTSGPGDGPCPPILGGMCVDLTGDIQLVGTGIANGDGEATITANVPANAPLIPISVQAVVRRGNNGNLSVKSNTMSQTVQ